MKGYTIGYLINCSLASGRVLPVKGDPGWHVGTVAPRNRTEFGAELLVPADVSADARLTLTHRHSDLIVVVEVVRLVKFLLAELREQCIYCFTLS